MSRGGGGVGGGALRLRAVRGHESRANDVVVVAARAPAAARPHTLLFFGGDVQDYPEVMEAHRDNRHYSKWNLVNTAKMLSHDFPNKHIIVVKPSRIEFKSFSCYDNFVPSNSAGVPDHTPTHAALHHLQSLLRGISNRIKEMSMSELLQAIASSSLPEDIDIEDLHNSTVQRGQSSKEVERRGGHQRNGSTSGKSNGAAADESQPSAVRWRELVRPEEGRLTLVGFSKGCVVLNQLIYEFHYTKTLTPGDAVMTRFIERIESMYWLDGGHAGGKNTWITSRSLLETLTRLDVNIYVHVSPYQVQDEGRPWIGREEKAFTGLLRTLGAKVSRHLHECAGAPHSLQVHFDVLDNFRRVQDATAADDAAERTDSDS